MNATMVGIKVRVGAILGVAEAAGVDVGEIVLATLATVVKSGTVGVAPVRGDVYATAKNINSVKRLTTLCPCNPIMIT